MASKTATDGNPTQEKKVEIPPIVLARMTVFTRGISPLLCHRMSEDTIKLIEDRQQKNARSELAARDPEKEWQSALYPFEEGGTRYGFPSAGIKKALVFGGYRFGDNVTTTRLRGLLEIPCERGLVEIRGSVPHMRRDVAVIPGKKRVTTLVYRAEFDRWEMDVPVAYNSKAISQSEVLNLFRIAGFSVGIGAWRPEKGGSFGVFEVRGAIENGVEVIG